MNRGVTIKERSCSSGKKGRKNEKEIRLQTKTKIEILYFLVLTCCPFSSPTRLLHTAIGVKVEVDDVAPASYGSWQGSAAVFLKEGGTVSIGDYQVVIPAFPGIFNIEFSEF